MQHATNKDDERRQFFDAHADGWETRNYSPETLIKVEQMLRELNLPDSGTILDAGCGQGVLVPYLRGMVGQDARLIALDASAPMLRAVSEKDSQVVALHAPAESIPLIGAYVDAIICFSAFPHFSDKAAVAQEFFRILKPGGKAHILHLMGREALSRHHDRHHAVEGDHLPCAHGMRTMFSEAGFAQTVLDDGPDHYYFTAMKAGGVA